MSELTRKKSIMMLETTGVVFITILILLDYLSISQVISTFLIFMILLEVVRMIKEFIVTSTIKLSVVIDSFIMFFIRDVVLIVSNDKYSFNDQVMKVGFFLALIFVFFIFRIMSLRYSPNDKNCKTCPAITHHSNKKHKTFV